MLLRIGRSDLECTLCSCFFPMFDVCFELISAAHCCAVVRVTPHLAFWNGNVVIRIMRVVISARVLVWLLARVDTLSEPEIQHQIRQGCVEAYFLLNFCFSAWVLLDWRQVASRNFKGNY